MDCKRCNTDKDDSEFYSNDKTCKACRKKLIRENTKKKRENPEWVEKERERCREKYHRLGYKGKQYEWDKDKVWKNTSTYKNLHRDLKIPKGISAHHWNYFKLKDVVLMDKKDHKAFHRLIELDVERRIFKVKQTGKYLDTRNKHLSFIVTSGFIFVEYNKNVNYQLVK